ncbi:HlyD family secretion protein [Massilia sp. H-1]|nr:HlyD family secretion protein [Massilia sp. H-1]
MIAGVAFLIATVLIGYVCLGTFTRKARVSGITVASGGIISIKAPNAGVMTQSYIAEGQYVKAGDPLFVLSTQNQSERGKITALVSNQLSARSNSLDQEERLRIGQTEENRRILELKQQGAQGEISQLEEEIVYAQRRHALAIEEIDRFQTLRDNGFVSEMQLQQKRKLTRGK